MLGLAAGESYRESGSAVEEGGGAGVCVLIISAMSSAVFDTVPKMLVSLSIFDSAQAA
jgi:hypothetical protein